MLKVTINKTNNYVNIKCKHEWMTSLTRKTLRMVGVKADPYYQAKHTVRVYLSPFYNRY